MLEIGKYTISQRKTMFYGLIFFCHHQGNIGNGGQKGGQKRIFCGVLS